MIRLALSTDDLEQTRVATAPDFDQAAEAAPTGIDPGSPAATAHLRDLARSGVLTPFTRALADGTDAMPSTFAPRIMFDPLAEPVTVLSPAITGPIARDPDSDAPPQALVSLLGATRAAALVAVVRTPALTTGRLAAALCISAAAASRHATVLRESGLIATVRNGQTVHHVPTRLGTDLVHGSITGDQRERGADATPSVVQ